MGYTFVFKINVKGSNKNNEIHDKNTLFALIQFKRIYRKKSTDKIICIPKSEEVID